MFSQEPEEPQEPDLNRQWEELSENLKPDINSFLWTRMPPQSTFREGEDLALDIFTKITDLWHRDLSK